MGEVVLLIGHGSRDSEGKRELADLVALVRAAVPGRPVEVGVLEFADSVTPSVDEALERCIRRGATSLRIVPVLLHAAMHAQTDVPAVLERAARRFPDLTLDAAPPLTAELPLLDILEERVCSTQAELSPRPAAETIVLLVGRGSSDAAANADFFRTGRLLAERAPGRLVECAFVSLAQPDVATALERCQRLGGKRLLVVPYFINTGILVKRISDQVAAFVATHLELEVVVTPHLGVHGRLVELLRARALGLPPAPACVVTGHDLVPEGNLPPSSFPLLERYGLPPAEIEALSQRRVQVGLPPGNRTGDAAIVMQRMVYAAGDPELAALVRVHPDAVAAALGALRRGEPVLTDVRMVEVALERGRLDELGLETRCAITAARLSGERPGLTRAAAGMISLADGLEGGIVVVGNAPTALLALLDLIDAGRAHPAMVVGTPVGFVAAVEAKAELAARETPFITVEGTRGGSAIAAAACNALLRLACAAPSEVPV